MPTPSFVPAAIRPATNVPCPCVSTVGGPRDEALRRGDAALELGVRPVDAGVDHRDPNRRERRELGPEVERAVLRRVPLARQERVVRANDDCAAPEPLDVADAPATPSSLLGAGAETASARIGARSTMSVAPRARSRSTTARAVGARREPDGETRCRCRRRATRPRPSGHGHASATAAAALRSLRLPRRDGDRQRRADRPVGDEPVGRRSASAAP